MAISADTSTGSNFLDVINLLSDPDKLRAEYQRLLDARAKAQAVLDQIDPATDVLTQRQAAIEKHAAADALLSATQRDSEARLSQATQEAEKIVATAQAEAEAILDAARAAKSQAEEMKEAADAAMSDAQALKSQVERLLANKGKSLDSATEAADQARAQAQAAETRFNALSAIITEHMTQLQEKLRADNSA